MPKRKCQEWLKDINLNGIENIKVENALLKLALGYRYKIKEVKNNKIITIEKEEPPNIQACEFWLKNRKPLNWGKDYYNIIKGLPQQYITISSSSDNSNRN